MDLTKSGSGGLTTGLSPSASPRDGLYQCFNMVSDIPGWTTKRRGIKQLSPTSNFTDVFSGASKTLLLPVAAWYFDDHIWVYVEDATSTNSVVSGICAYSMVTNAGWHKVVESSSFLALDRTQFKMRQTTCDRRQLISTAAGVKRVASVYSDYYPKDSSNNVNYSTMYRNAGIPRALDPRCPNAVAGGATLPGLIAAAGYEWLLLSSAVAYRIAWIKRDENAILGIGSPSGRIVVRNTSTTTNYATRLKTIIPSGVTDSSYVMQIYRTNIVSIDQAGVIPDPGDDMFLAGEYRLTSTDLSNGYVLYEDISFDGLLGEALYTNENQDGNLQGRLQPPIARDLAYYGGCAFYANTTERQRLTIKVLAVDSTGAAKGVRVGDMLVMGDLVMEGVAVANEEVQTWYFAIDATAGAGSEVIRALKTAESICYKYNQWSNAKNGRYAAYNLTTNNDIVGVIGLEEKSIGGTTGAYLGVNRVDSPIQVLPAPVFTSTPSNTLAQACQVVTNVGPTTVTVTTAAAHNLTTNDLVFLAPFATSTEAGTSSPQLANTDVPAGVYKVTVTGATTFTFPSPSGAASNQTDARAATTGGYVHKIFDSTNSIWTEARSENNRRPNRLMWSPTSEPESVPIENFVDLGSADKAILKIIPTQDSLFVFKEDGLWRLKGEAADWEVIVFDGACILAAPESADVVGGQVYCYTTNGVVAIDDGGVKKVSQKVGGAVDNRLRALATYPSTALTYVGCGHGEDQAYWLSFGGTDLYRYHLPTKTWSRHFFDDKATASGNGVVSFVNTVKASRYTTFDNQAYAERLLVTFSSTANCIGVERKTGQITDFADLDVAVSVSSINTSSNSVTLASVPSSVTVGDVFLWVTGAQYGGYSVNSSNIQYRATISAINGNDLTLAISGAVPALSSWPGVGAANGYVMKQIQGIVGYMPFEVEDGVSLGKFSEVIVSTGSRGRFSAMDIWFNTETGFPITNLTTAQSTSSVNGFAYRDWATAWTPRSDNMGDMVAVRTGVPRASTTGTSLLVRLVNSRAMELFDVASIRVIGTAGDNKVRKTNA